MTGSQKEQFRWFSKNLRGVITIGIALIVSVSTIFIEASHAETLIIALLGVVIGTVVGEWYKENQYHDLNLHSRLLLDNPEIKSNVLRIAENYAAIDDNLPTSNLAARMKNIYSDELERNVAYLSEISAGHITVENPVHERRYTRILLSFAEKRVRATSVYEELFWDYDETDTYLESQRELIAQKGIDIERIFIFEVNNPPVEFPIDKIKLQLSMGMRIGIIWAKDYVREDLILYDDTYVRIGRNQKPGRPEKHLYCTSNRNYVESRMHEFEALWEQATIIDDIDKIEECIEAARKRGETLA